MKLSTRSRYAVRMMFELAKHYQQGPLQLRNVSRIENISEKYLGQIVIPLRAAGLVGSIRGAQGGYELARAPEEITVNDIVEVMEGPIVTVGCVRDNNCERINECSAYEVWKELDDNIRNTLKAHTLKDMLESDKRKREKTLNYTI